MKYILLNLTCYWNQKKKPTHFPVNHQFLTENILFIACLVLPLCRYWNKSLDFLLSVHFFCLTVLAEIFDQLSLATNYCWLKSTNWTTTKRTVKYFNLILNTLHFIGAKIMIMYSLKTLTQNVCLLYLS